MSQATRVHRMLTIRPQPALLALIVGGACIGLAPIFARLSDVGPFATGGYRMAIALLVSGALLAGQGGDSAARAESRLRRLRPADLAFAALAGVFFAGDLACFFWALGETSVAHATLLVNLAPVFALLGGWLLFAERPRRSTLVGLAVALAGAAMLSLGGADAGVTSLKGDLGAVAAAVFYAAYLVAVKRARRGIPSDVFLVVSGASAMAALFPLSMLAGEAMVPVTWQSVLALLGLGLIGHALAHRLISNGLAVLPVGYASVVLLVQPTVAAIVAWAAFGEALDAVELLGIAAALTGITLASRGGP